MLKALLGRKESGKDFLKRLGIQGNFLLTPGSLLPYRRCEDIIGAFSSCAREDKGIQLVIAGSGTDDHYMNVIREAIAASPVRERILLLGQVPWDIMEVLYRDCLACVIATEIEACPNIAIEAMAAGCVIVACNRQPLPEIFAGCALEYEARDIRQLSEHIRKATKVTLLRQELREKALRRAEAFSWEICADRTFAALTKWS